MERDPESLILFMRARFEENNATILHRFECSQEENARLRQRIAECEQEGSEDSEEEDSEEEDSEEEDL